MFNLARSSSLRSLVSASRCFSSSPNFLAGVGTKKVYSDPRGSVWEMRLKPGETAQLHEHHADYCFYVVSGSTLEVSDADGKVIDNFVLEAGTASGFKLKGDFLEPVDQSQGVGIRVPAAHSAKNVGKTEFYEVLFEHPPGRV